MNNNEGKKYLIIAITGVVLIICAVISIFFIYRSRINQQDNKVEENNEYVTILEDGTKQNTSEKLKKEKKFEELDITDIQLVEKGDITHLTGIITNNTKKVKAECTATITLIDPKGNELTQMKIYIKELNPSESTRLNASATLDYASAYDFIIKKD